MDQIRESGYAWPIVSLFLSGVAAQVFAALLYKWSMWYLYMGELHHDFKSKWRYRAADWTSDNLWLDIGFDLLTIVPFATATLLVLRALLGPV